MAAHYFELDDTVIACEGRDGAIIGGLAFFGEEAAGHLIGFAMVSNAFAAVAALITRVGAGAHFKILCFC